MNDTEFKLIRGVGARANNHDKKPLPFRVLQRVAFCDPQDGVPGPFTFVMFHELSEGGCSFLSDTHLLSGPLIIELGSGADARHLRASIIHVTPMLGGEGKGFLAFCKFIARID